MSRRPQARGDARRTVLLNAAAKLVETTDPGAVSFKEIALEAGVPQPSCYHFFAGRDELLLALWEREHAGFREAAFAPVPGALTWMEVIEAVLARVQAFYAAHPTALRLLPLSNIPRRFLEARDARSHANAAALIAMLEQDFHLPPLAQRVETFDWALKIAEMILTWSYVRANRITDESRQEATRAMIAYLGNYLPRIV